MLGLGLWLAHPQAASATDTCRPIISVAEAVVDRDEIERQVRDVVCETLREHQIDIRNVPLSRSVVVDVSHVDAAWLVSVTVRDDSVPTRDRDEPAVCRCDDETMLVMLSSATAAIVPVLRSETQASTDDRATPVSPDQLPPVPPPSPGLLDPLGTMGRVGIGMLAGGTGGSVLGISFVVSGSRVRGRLRRGGSQDLRVAGYSLLGASLAVGITGAVLLGLDRRRARTRPRQALVVPAIGPDLFGLGVHGCF